VQSNFGFNEFNQIIFNLTINMRRFKVQLLEFQLKIYALLQKIDIANLKIDF